MDKLAQLEKRLVRTERTLQLGTQDSSSDGNQVPITEHATQLFNAEETSPSKDSPSLTASEQQQGSEILEISIEEDPEPTEATGRQAKGAARLLLVAPIAEMCKGIMGSADIENEMYPSVQEQRREPLLLFGKSEELVDHEYSSSTVRELVNSYEQHMNNMHPILVPSQLDTLVSRFVTLNQSKLQQTSTVAARCHPTAGHSQCSDLPRSKRKRADSREAHSECEPSLPFASITSAIVLLVMALGKVCQHKGKIPDRVLANTPTTLHAHWASASQSSTSTPIRKAPIEGKDWGHFRNATAHTKETNVIPGLAYFTLATDILGNQQQVMSLQHAQANILAGLYYGQLGRVAESYANIAKASNIVQVNLRP